MIGTPEATRVAAGRRRKLPLGSSSRRQPGRCRHRGRRGEGHLADGGAEHRRDRDPEEQPVLRHEADHPRDRGRLRHQLVVAGLVRGRTLRGGQMPERQADRPRRRRRPAAHDLGRQLAHRPGGERDRDHPGLRQGRARGAPGRDQRRREGGAVGRRSRRGRRQGLRHLRRLERSRGRDDVGQLDGQGAEGEGQRHLPRRPRGQPGRRASSRRSTTCSPSTRA